MPRLTFSNDLVSRDEALHTEFAVLLYSKFNTRIIKKILTKLFEEAVTIEKDFITQALPYRLIGMNSDLMTTYILHLVKLNMCVFYIF